MRNFLIALFLMLEGCVVYSPRHHIEYVVNSSNVSSVQTTSTSTIKETLPQPKVIVQTKETASTGCSVFVLPAAGELPVRPIFTDPEVGSKIDPDVLLTAYIKELRAYIDNERTQLERAHKRWASSCKQ